jgi:hypothetical protein
VKKALIVGIDNYPGKPLFCCKNDAEAIGNILRRNGDGTVNFDTKVMLDVGSKSELKSAINECFAGNADIALFYFSGHGIIDTISGYIVTPDHKMSDWGVSMQEILTIVNVSKCKNKIVILDCCHAGFMGSVNITGQDMGVIQEGVTILSASKYDEVAIEIGGHGVFTSLLLDALKGGAADITGHITAGGIYAYIDRALGPWRQRPVFKTYITQFLPLRTVKPQVDIAVLQRICEYFHEPTDEYALNPSFEYTNTPNVEHEVLQPYAEPSNVAIFKDLQKLESIGLVIPCEVEHMYFAAIQSKSCNRSRYKKTSIKHEGASESSFLKGRDDVDEDH